MGSWHRRTPLSHDYEDDLHGKMKRALVTLFLLSSITIHSVQEFNYANNHCTPTRGSVRHNTQKDPGNLK